MLAFYEDGYTRTVGFREAAGLHPAFWFTYRPYEGAEGEEIWNRIFTSNTFRKDAEREVLGRMLDWSFDRERSAANLAKLSGVIFGRIQNVIRGGLAPDFDSVNGPAADAELRGTDAPNS